MQIEAVFENISERIKIELWNAQKTIYIAVAWFTNKELFDILKIKAKNNCKILLIINNDEINNNSSIDFEDINNDLFKVFKVGQSEKDLMHNKFCIIDYSTVITGSYNWSYRAQSNYENIIITYNDNILASQFTKEFNKLLEVFQVGEFLQEDVFPLHVVLKRLEIIKNFISLNDISSLKQECNIIEEYKFHPYIANILNSIQSKDYKSAVSYIDDFIRQSQQIELWIDKDIALLKTEIRKLENQINAYDNEKTEIEKTISSFHYRHRHELGDIILKILSLRKVKYKYSNEKFREAELDEEQYQKDFNLEKSKNITKLTSEEQTELKFRFRKATTLCHPDKVDNKLKESAQRIFIELKTAYDSNDLLRVSEILEELEDGNFFKPSSETITEKEVLLVEISKLKIIAKSIEKFIINIKQSEAYKKIMTIGGDWDKYFIDTKNKLQAELKRLENELANEL